MIMVMLKIRMMVMLMGTVLKIRMMMAISNFTTSCRCGSRRWRPPPPAMAGR